MRIKLELLYYLDSVGGRRSGLRPSLRIGNVFKEICRVGFCGLEKDMVLRFLDL